MQILKNTNNTRLIISDSLRYIRSDVPVDISPEEIQFLIDNDITTIIDLREDSEMLLKKCPLEINNTFNYIHVPITGGNSIPKSIDDVSLSYINMVDDKMIGLINKILYAKTNVMYFCNAGKDRTGVVSAILLRKLGYDDDYIISDYLKSGENLRHILNEFANANKDIDINVITPKAEYMQKFLEWLDNNNIV